MRVDQRLEGEGSAAAMLSAGNTGTVMAAGLIDASRIKGVHRPAICAAFPTKQRPTVVIDLGANIDPTPLQLAQFALTRAAYAKSILLRDRPRVAVPWPGSEEQKGSDLSRDACALLE